MKELCYRNLDIENFSFSLWFNFFASGVHGIFKDRSKVLSAMPLGMLCCVVICVVCVLFLGGLV